MNKAQLIKVVREELGPNASKQDATMALNASLNAIIKSVAREKVQIVGFGTFQAKVRAPHKGRNPRTGESIQIPASRSVSFKPAAALKKG
ncbi:MAG: HU family DNA-binding protein [Akkermansia sp.]|nr:HU family DNA-binding protein [Akkermansia sp.]